MSGYTLTGNGTIWKTQVETLGEAWCNGNDKDGRTYIISLSACDTAGNETTVRDTLVLGADKTAKARDRW